MTLLYLILYFLFCFALPTIRIYKKTGINPITFKNNDNAHDLIGLYMKITMAFTFLGALEKEKIINLNFSLLFENHSVAITGIALMAISLIWIITAQLQMSDSWRIGIDEKNPTVLRKSGLFGLSRNPIFLGMIVSQLGLFLYYPTVLNLIVLVVAYILISIQIRMEEEFLYRMHGNDYMEFRKDTPRWILF